ncbi:IgGFc-binding protein-like [Diadema antillarum]|uniref:IgGFc-binding protein-like n=1 Tax=Diadema antillarum TaxID=105358 RepID=UPI003A8900D7
MEITLLTRFVGLFSFCIVMKSTSTFAADNAGREFVFAFPPNYEFQEPGNLRLLIHPTEQTTQTLMNVTITYRGTSYSLALDLRSPPYNVSLPSDLALTRISCLTNSTVVVQTDHDIILVAANFETRSMDTFVVLPTSYLGKEYFVATTPQRNSWAILISASSEPVTVEVAVKYHVTFLGKDYKSGDVIRTSLSPFETMQLEPFVNENSVTRILANASVSVTVGCTCATIPNVTIGGCDFIAEHLAPFDRWGQSFVLSPFVNRQSGYMYQVISGRNNTRVWIGGDVLILHMGEYYTRIVTRQEMTSVTSNHPIMVLQYSMGTENDQRPGDPALLMVPHMDQFKSFAEFPIIDFSSAAINDVYVSVTTDCNATSEILLNNSIINQISWLEEYSVETWNHRNMCTVWMAVEGGGYVLRSRDSGDANSPVATFMSLVYGTGHRIGFIYTAGNFFDELTCSDTGDTLTGNGQEVVPCQRLQSRKFYYDDI